MVARWVMVGFCWGFGSRWVEVACGGFMGWFAVFDPSGGVGCWVIGFVYCKKIIIIIINKNITPN